MTKRKLLKNSAIQFWNSTCTRGDRSIVALANSYGMQSAQHRRFQICRRT